MGRCVHELNANNCKISNNLREYVGIPMASKNLKSNRTRITEDRREDKTTRAAKPWRRVSIEFCLGVAAMAVAFVLTPLGSWCVTRYEPTVISVTKCDHKPQPAAMNRASQRPDPEELARLAQARVAQGGRSRKSQKPKDPLAELRRIEAINAQNRRMMTHRTAAPGHAHPHPQPTVPQPPGVGMVRPPSTPR
jgi:hypothetical protein